MCIQYIYTLIMIMIFKHFIVIIVLIVTTYILLGKTLLIN